MGHNMQTTPAKMSKEIVSLLDDGLITEIEYRMFASGHRPGAIFNILLSKYKQNPADVIEIFRRLTSEDENNQDIHLRSSTTKLQSSINPINIEETGKNPLLNNEVLLCIFDFSSVEDIKKFRLVCRQWNITAEPLLRKRSRIHFNLDSLVPKQFVQATQHWLPDLPFTSFKFSNKRAGKLNWDFLDLQRFFDIWGKNIQELNFHKIVLSQHYNFGLNSSTWFRKMINLTKLTIITDEVISGENHSEENAHRHGTRFEIRLEILYSIKSLYLQNCGIRLPPTYKEKNRHIMPLEITLNNVRFKQIHDYFSDIRLNDFIDFSQATKICVATLGDTIMDVGNQIFNVENIRLLANEIANFENAKGKFEFFQTSAHYMHANHLDIKQLRLTSSKVDLFVLPKTIQKLHLDYCSEIICSLEFELPELQFLYCQSRRNDFNMLSRFSACQNLVELQIAAVKQRGNEPAHDFRVEWIPKSVKRMKIRNIKLVGPNRSLSLDTLIIEIKIMHDDVHYDSFFANVEKSISMISKLKLKVLVMSCKGIHFPNLQTYLRRKEPILWDAAFSTKIATNIVTLNKKFGKIVLGVDVKFDEVEGPREENHFTNIVDKKANYYTFTNQRGNAISREEFEEWTKMNALDKYK